MLALEKVSSKKRGNYILYIGDSDLDIKFAKKNKCYSVFLENKILNKNDLKIKPDLTIKNLKILNNFI